MDKSLLILKNFKQEDDDKEDIDFYDYIENLKVSNKYPLKKLVIENIFHKNTYEDLVPYLNNNQSNIDSIKIVIGSDIGNLNQIISNKKIKNFELGLINESNENLNKSLIKLNEKKEIFIKFPIISNTNLFRNKYSEIGLDHIIFLEKLVLSDTLIKLISCILLKNTIT